ncbi:hypothetical protein B0J14DRAFT_679511 [Halenospora varia]|nr:hypothetical protein B0J14DRAFT_679511 [Halenospora varia]
MDDFVEAIENSKILSGIYDGSGSLDASLSNNNPAFAISQARVGNEATTEVPIDVHNRGNTHKAQVNRCDHAGSQPLSMATTLEPAGPPILNQSSTSVERVSEPYGHLDQFFSLLNSGETIIHFPSCVRDVIGCLDRTPTRLEHRRDEALYLPDFVIPRCVRSHIMAQVNRRSCFESRLNAIMTLLKIGLAMANEGLRPKTRHHVLDFQDGRLASLLVHGLLFVLEFEIDPVFTFWLTRDEGVRRELSILIHKNRSAGQEAVFEGLDDVLKHFEEPVAAVPQRADDGQVACVVGKYLLFRGKVMLSSSDWMDRHPQN